MCVCVCVCDYHRVPGEIKRREVELDPQISPEEIMSSREVELRCESCDFFRFELFLNSSATDIVLVTLPKHGSLNSNCAVHKSLGNGEGTPPKHFHCSGGGPRSLRSFSGGIRNQAFTLSPSAPRLHTVPVPNKQPRFCGREAIWSRSGSNTDAGQDRGKPHH